MAEMRTEVEALWKATDRRFAEQMAESRKMFDEGMAEMRKEMVARDRIMDERIGVLITAIRDLIRKMA